MYYLEQVTDQLHKDTRGGKSWLKLVFKAPQRLPRFSAVEKNPKDDEQHRSVFMLNMFIYFFFFDDKRYITPYSTKNTHWKIQDISR